MIREKFGLAQMVMAGDCGMITSARIRALNQLEDGTARPDPYTGTQVTIAMLAEPTSAQRQAFELIGAPIPLTLK